MYVDIRDPDFFKKARYPKFSPKTVEESKTKSERNNERRQVLKGIRREGTALARLQERERKIVRHKQDVKRKHFEHAIQTEKEDINKLKSTSYLPTTKKQKRDGFLKGAKRGV